MNDLLKSIECTGPGQSGGTHIALEVELVPSVLLVWVEEEDIDAVDTLLVLEGPLPPPPPDPPAPPPPHDSITVVVIARGASRVSMIARTRRRRSPFFM